MTRAEVKHAIQNALPTPNVPDELVWEVLTECIAEQTGQQPRLVTLMESVQPPDAHARMRALLEASNTPRSDLKADDHEKTCVRLNRRPKGLRQDDALAWCHGVHALLIEGHGVVREGR